MLPTGIICLWSGAIVDIPAGWTLCDGTAGTPDLRDRFILAAGGGSNPGDIGGALVHQHAFTGDGHSHTLAAGTQVAIGANFQNTTSSDAASGLTDTESSLPPYYALAYIMKT